MQSQAEFSISQPFLDFLLYICLEDVALVGQHILRVPEGEWAAVDMTSNSLSFRKHNLAELGASGGPGDRDGMPPSRL